MRGTLLLALPSRIKGRYSLENRVRRLLIAAIRYDRGRARTPDDRRFAAALIDGLSATLNAIDPGARVLDVPRDAPAEREVRS